MIRSGKLIDGRTFRIDTGPAASSCGGYDRSRSRCPACRHGGDYAHTYQQDIIIRSCEIDGHEVTVEEMRSLFDDTFLAGAFDRMMG